MVKIKKMSGLNEYKEIIEKLNPVLSNDFISDVQSYIENQFVIYTEEDIKNEEFLTFVSDKWADEVTVKDVNESPIYSFSLYSKEEAVVEVELSLGIDESESAVLVTGVTVNQEK